MLTAAFGEWDRDEVLGMKADRRTELWRLQSEQLDNFHCGLQVRGRSDAHMKYFGAAL